MLVIDYKKKFHNQIIEACVLALKKGKVLAYPTDTCYGLAVDATNIKAIKKLYQIKGRDFNKPVHVVVPSLAYAKKIARWNSNAGRLVKKFWPGPLTLILPLGKGLDSSLRRLSAKTGSIGLRVPDNKIAMDLAKLLKRPITATSSNLSGRPDCYSAESIIEQFSARGGSASHSSPSDARPSESRAGGKNQKHKPDIIINAGKLPKRKPSTLVRVFDDVVKILREGPISEKQILKIVNSN